MKKFLLLVGAMFVALPAMAKECTQTIEGNDLMQFNLKEIKVAGDCTSLKLTLKHVGKANKTAMGHNWVLAETKNLDKIVQDGAKAGAAKDYLDPKSAGLIAHTKMLGGGQSDTITIDLTKLKKRR